MKRLMFVAVLSAAFMSQAEICVKDGETIAFMGDSITAGGNGPAGYCNMVMKALDLLGVRKCQKIAAGVGGNKSVQMHERLDRDVLARKDGKTAHWMTFSCGVNDVWHGANGVPLEKYRELVADIFDRCAAKNVKVIVLTPTLIREEPNNKENKKLDSYVAWLKEEAAKRKLPVADLNAAMKAELARIRETDKSPGNKLTRDGVHMQFAGNCMMAWGVLKTMGVADADKDRIFAAWRDMPEAYEPKVGWTANEWESIVKKAADARKTPVKYIHDIVVESTR